MDHVNLNPTCFRTLSCSCVFIVSHGVNTAAGAFDLKREAAMALWQLCKDGRHLSSAVEAGALPLFLDLIRLPDVRASNESDPPVCTVLQYTACGCLMASGLVSARSRWLDWGYGSHKWCWIS